MLACMLCVFLLSGGGMMSSDRDKRAVFGKGIAFDPCQLRDPWENRAQKISEKGQQEKEGQENRDLNR